MSRANARPLPAESPPPVPPQVAASAPPVTLRQRLVIVSQLPITQAEGSALYAALLNASADGEVWTSITNWAAAAHVSENTLRAAIRSLVDKRIMQVVEPSKGGRACTAKYLIVPFANPSISEGFGKSSTIANPSTSEGFDRTETLQSGPRNPSKSDRNPSKSGLNPSAIEGEHKEQIEHKENTHTGAASPRVCAVAPQGVEAGQPKPEPVEDERVVALIAAGLGRHVAVDLVKRHRPTIERIRECVAIAERPGVRNKAATIRSAITEGWQPQPQQAAQSRPTVDAAWQEAAQPLLDALPSLCPSDQREVVQRVRGKPELVKAAVDALRAGIPYSPGCPRVFWDQVESRYARAEVA